MQAEDKIKIFNNGDIKRTADSNPYDTITNEDESKSIQIARTNVTDANPTGDSQIGPINTIPLKIPGMDEAPGGEKFTFFQIQNYDTATQFFEFAALNTGVEFRQELFSFSDGGSTNTITTNGMKNLVFGVGDIFEKDYSFSTGHNIRNSTKIEMSHSHPDENPFWPSGYNNHGKDSNPTFTPGLPWYDRKSANAKNNYVFSKYLHNLNGGGYIKYDTEKATYTKTKK
nr:JAB-like toxin 1 domain-containing protein [uncultured Chryseobacterium sp.]